MGYFDLDFLGSAKEIDPKCLKLNDEITGHKNKLKKKNKS
jgi:hypothetical protein